MKICENEKRVGNVYLHTTASQGFNNLSGPLDMGREMQGASLEN